MLTTSLVLLLCVTAFPWPTSSQHCQFTKRSLKAEPCSRGMREVYKERDIYTGKFSRLCCVVGSKGEKKEVAKATSCRPTRCESVFEGGLCSSISERYINGSKLEYEDVRSDSCYKRASGAHGVVSLCCQPQSKEVLGFIVGGAEPNEFPHHAALHAGHYTCGATVYNKRFIITAAHCVVDKGKVINPNKIKISLGGSIGGVSNAEHTYKAIRVLTHENYVYSDSHGALKTHSYADIALLQLERDIKFVHTVKSLEIAPRDFVPSEYADTVVGVGRGLSDTNAVTVYIQKANFLLRSDHACATYLSFRGEAAKRLLCLGGQTDGKFSAVSGSGDSGGAAVCRKQDGLPVLCGLTSFGDARKPSCIETNDCRPSGYVDVGFYHDWIREHAGAQNPETFHRQYLYGKVTLKNEYEHQVHITSSEGKPCGGTLITPNLVVTAAQCVSDGENLFSSVKVTAGLWDLTKDRGKTFGVFTVATLPGFQRNPDAVKNSEGRIVIADSYYTNDLAVLKLDGNVSISKGIFPGLPWFGEKYDRGVEIAFPRDTRRGGQLRTREFDLMTWFECRNRMSHIQKFTHESLDKNVMCAVEVYSGGSTCDRELGGGLICEGEDGEDVLCGVQIYRLCELALPNRFINVADHADWIAETS